MLEERLYDIVKTDTYHPLTFYCLGDEQETELFSYLQEDVNKQTQDPKNPLNKSAKLIFEMSYIVEDVDLFKSYYDFDLLANKLETQYTNNYRSIQFSPESPPPLG